MNAPTNVQGETPLSSTTSQPEESGQPENTPGTTEADDSTGSDGDHPRTDVSHATVVIGTEVRMFAQVDEDGKLDENGACDPEYFGVQFRAILRPIDEQGNDVSAEGSGEAIGPPVGTFAFTDGDPEEGTVVLPDGWMASVIQGRGSVETVNIDNNTARGTATFVDEDANTVDGTFEVVCVG